MDKQELIKLGFSVAVDPEGYTYILQHNKPVTPKLQTRGYTTRFRVYVGKQRYMDYDLLLKKLMEE